MRLFVHVEGQTEEEFVDAVLAPHLYGFGYHQVQAIHIGNATNTGGRRGIIPWPAASRDIGRHLLHDRTAFATTMVDYYGLPATGARAWPGRSVAATQPFANRSSLLKAEIGAAFTAQYGGSGIERRFLPFVILHEYEGLLFSDCAAFARGIEQPHLVPKLQAIRNSFSSPEEINDSYETSPSRRIEGLYHGYQKPLHGALAALAIGLPKMRAECESFHEWVTQLEHWPNSGVGF